MKSQISFSVNRFCKKVAIFENIFILWSAVAKICINRTRYIMARAIYFDLKKYIFDFILAKF